MGQTVDFELYAQYLWKRHTNWKTRPPVKNICVTELNHTFYYAYWDMTTGLLIIVHCQLPRLKAYESWVNFDCIFLSFVQTSFREFGRGVWAHTLRVYKVFTKTGQGPWLRGDSALGPPV